jgi:glycosyltransferase involved in cell wall biosynthesis
MHIHPTFSRGGAETRTARIVEHLAGRFRHTVVALDGRLETSATIDPRVPVRYPDFRGSANPVATTGGLIRLIRSRNPDLVLTYNWGSMDAVAACCWTGTPFVHTEDGFNADEAVHQKRRRVWTRRLLLRRARRVVAPSLALRRIMHSVWKLPERATVHIPNGIPTGVFTPRPPGGSPPPELIVGTVASLTAVKRQTWLIDVCASLARDIPLRLVMAGDGPERLALEKRALELGFRDRAEFLGLQNDVLAVYHRLEIFALSSVSEQMPIAVLEAMACGLPVVGTAVGDIREMVSESNRPFIVDGKDQLRGALAHLAANAELRRRIGEDNRRRCQQTYDLSVMLSAYESLYTDVLAAMGR